MLKSCDRWSVLPSIKNWLVNIYNEYKGEKMKTACISIIWSMVWQEKEKNTKEDAAC